MSLEQALADVRFAITKIAHPLLELEKSLSDALTAEAAARDAEARRQSAEAELGGLADRLAVLRAETDAEAAALATAREETTAERRRLTAAVKAAREKAERELAKIAEELEAKAAEARQAHEAAMKTIGDDLAALTGKRDAMLREVETLKAKFG